MPRTVTFQTPALPGAPTVTVSPSTGSAIDEPYLMPSGSVSTTAIVLASTVARAATQAVLLSTVKLLLSAVPTGVKKIENGTAGPPGISSALLLTSRSDVTVAPKSLRSPAASATAA